MAKLDFPDASYSPWVAPNNVIYTYIGTSPNGYWEANTANAATNLTAVFVERTGSTMTGALKLDNAASVSLPDISFDGDVNTGLYSPGADSLAIVTAGTQRVVIDSSGTATFANKVQSKNSTNIAELAPGASTGFRLLQNGSTANVVMGWDGTATFAGAVTAPTASSGTNTTQLATTAFVTAAVAAGGSGGGSPFSTDIVVNSLTVGRGSGNVSSNTALGDDALNAVTTGANLVGVGKGALFTITSGNNCTALGVNALRVNTASDAVAVGKNALYSNTIAGFNVALGGNALYANTTGAGNTGIGYTAGDNITTGGNNIVIGATAAASSATVSNEITLGNTSINSLRIPGLQSGASDGDVLTYSSSTGKITLAAGGGGGGGGGAMEYISTTTVSSATASVGFDLSSTNYDFFILKAYGCKFTAAPTNGYCVYFNFYDGAYNPSSVGTNRMSLRYQRSQLDGSSVTSSSAWSYNMTLFLSWTPTTSANFGFNAEVGGKTNSPITINSNFLEGTSTSSGSPSATGVAPNSSNNMTYMTVMPSSTTFAAGKFLLYGVKNS